MTCSLFCIGHPLLDMQVTEGEAILAKYDLQANDAILAEDKHLPIYDELAENYDVTFVAGGAAQNTARGAAYILPPNSVVYAGCIGDDEFATILKAANTREGVFNLYDVRQGEKTGACAVVITGHHRSLVTTLRSARLLQLDHFISPTVSSYLESAKVVYVEGYIISHALDILHHLGQNSCKTNNVFAFNFSAPYIPQYFSNELEQILPYCDILIANETEAQSWAIACGHPAPTDLLSVGKSIATSPKASSTRPRIVVLTQGADSTLVVTENAVNSYPVPPVENIVDTNAAGDAFAGGFLGAYVSGYGLDACVAAGHKLAGICIGEVGPQFKWPKVPVL